MIQLSGHGTKLHRERVVTNARFTNHYLEKDISFVIN